MIGSLVFFALCYMSGLLYNLGGYGQPYNTKYRDFGVPIVTAIIMAHLGLWNSWVLLSSFLLFGALTTYWDDLSKHFENQDRWCWIFVGLGYSLSILPWVISTGAYVGFIIRSIVLTIATVVWSEQTSNVVYEEQGRGILIPLTLPLLTIGI